MLAIWRGWAASKPAARPAGHKVWLRTGRVGPGFVRPRGRPFRGKESRDVSKVTVAPVEGVGPTARLKRRGLAAGIGALTALVLARLGARPVEAADGQPLVIG